MNHSMQYQGIWQHSSYNILKILIFKNIYIIFYKAPNWKGFPRTRINK